MALLLRFVRQNRWQRTDDVTALIAAGDVPPDPLNDLNTKSNTLSVWDIDDEKSNLQRVIRAYTLMRDTIDHTGFVIFPSKVLEDAGISSESVDGATPDTVANRWHRRVTLTGNKILALAKGMIVSGESDQVLKKDLREALEKAAKENEFPAEALDKFNKAKCHTCGK